MGIKIALAGNPNCGKTTLFNALTGSSQYVGNWPGVTVEKKEGKLKTNKEVTIMDLPGIYSLSPYTLEEVVSRNYLVTERPDAILNIVDGTNLERNLYLTTQLLELGIPVVVAVNMMDVIKKNGDEIKTDLLSQELGCPVIEISALKGHSVTDAADAAVKAAEEHKEVIPAKCFSGEIEHVIAHIEEASVHEMPESQQRWYAIKLFERDEKVLEQLKLDEKTVQHIESDIAEVEKTLDDDSESIITNERYVYIAQILKNAYKKKAVGELSISDKIDKIVTNRILALPIFVLVMFLVYYISMGGSALGTFLTDTTNDWFGDVAVPAVAGWLTNIGIVDWLTSLIADGIVGGVGAVLGFVPQLLVLYLLLAILEDVGYMSRVAFIMDRIFRKFGLSGKSFIPMLVATGCGVPGIMASRTIEQDRDRKMTIMTTGFIPCGAKMPIVGLISAALFGGSAWIATASYFIGVGAVIISGIMLKKTKPFAGDPAPFVMELPAYHAPQAKNVLRATWERGWSFIKRAGTIILASSVVIWILNSLSFDGGFHYLSEEAAGRSILEVIGSAVKWLFYPLGFGTWEAVVATVLGLVAKEEVVGVFGTLSTMLPADADAMAMAEEVDTHLSVIGQQFFGGSALSGFSFLVFNLLCAPCFAAIGAIKREMNNPKWTIFAVAYMCAFAYAISLIIYQLGAWFLPTATGVVGGNIIGTIAAVAVLAAILYFLFRKNKYKDNVLSADVLKG